MRWRVLLAPLCRWYPLPRDPVNVLWRFEEPGRYPLPAASSGVGAPVPWPRKRVPPSVGPAIVEACGTASRMSPLAQLRRWHHMVRNGGMPGDAGRRPVRGTVAAVTGVEPPGLHEFRAAGTRCGRRPACDGSARRILPIRARAARLRSRSSWLVWWLVGGMARRMARAKKSGFGKCRLALASERCYSARLEIAARTRLAIQRRDRGQGEAKRREQGGRNQANRRSVRAARRPPKKNQKKALTSKPGPAYIRLTTRAARRWRPNRSPLCFS